MKHSVVLSSLLVKIVVPSADLFVMSNACTASSYNTYHCALLKRGVFNVASSELSLELSSESLLVKPGLSADVPGLLVPTSLGRPAAVELASVTGSILRAGLSGIAPASIWLCLVISRCIVSNLR
jgi:hypothetical protein